MSVSRVSGVRAGAALLTACALMFASGCASLARDLGAQLAAEDALAGARWGLVVERADGTPLASIRGDERFIPASNTKMFVAAAAYDRLPDVSLPDLGAAASLHIAPRADGPPDLVLVGRGDGTLSDAPDCARNCLAHLVEIVQQNRIERVNTVIADATLFADERWPSGMSWNNIPTRSGTAMSALTVNDNEVVLLVRPGEREGAPAIVQWRDGDAFMDVRNETTTIAQGADDLRITRLPNDATIGLYGVISLGANPVTMRFGVDDPALFAAWRFTRLLQAAGVAVDAPPQARYRAPSMADDPAVRPETFVATHAKHGLELGRLLPQPTGENLSYMMKVSQNLHADLLLRRLGVLEGVGSAADGHRVIEAMLAEAGVDPGAYTFADGSGMSIYNRVTPQAVVDFLRWTQTQPWGEAFRASLPVGGKDGTLARRFAGTPLEGRVFAKTGSLSAVSALSGFIIAASGRELVFSFIVNDWPPGAGSATAAMDRALLEIARRN